MASNRGVAYVGPGQVEVQGIPFPKLEDPRGRKGRGNPRTWLILLLLAAADGELTIERMHQIGTRELPLDVQYLRLRPAHGAWPHDGAHGADPGP